MARTLGRGNPQDDSDGFRRTLGQFGTGVAVMTTRVKNIDYGVTSNSFASVSLEPPLVLWSIKKTSQSYAAFLSAKRFAINILAKDQIAVSNRFAQSGGDKFVDLRIERGAGECPLLVGSVAVLECTAWNQYDGGDHTILVGKVETFTRYDRQSLIFSQGRYARVDTATLASNFAPEAMRGRPDDVSGHTLATSMRLAYGALLDRLKVARDEVGLNHAQAAIANALLRQPALYGAEVATMLGFGLNYSEAEYEDMSRRGIIETDSDGRLSLTPLGKTKIEKLRIRGAEIEGDIIASFSTVDRTAFRRIIDHLASS